VADVGGGDTDGGEERRRGRVDDEIGDALEEVERGDEAPGRAPRRERFDSHRRRRATLAIAHRRDDEAFPSREPLGSETPESDHDAPHSSPRSTLSPCRGRPSAARRLCHGSTESVSGRHRRDARGRTGRRAMRHVAVRVRLPGPRRVRAGLAGLRRRNRTGPLRARRFPARGQAPRFSGSLAGTARPGRRSGRGSSPFSRAG
jgi:hypothetical protein